MKFSANLWRCVFSTLAIACLTLSFSIGRLADFSLSATDEIKLQAAVVAPVPADTATLNGALRSIEIRTALEDTQRLRFELG
ncbi:hypothetical protein BPNPMPFG_002542 [Mesorhizobium sp. AR07]|uniref:hypothetical protein n=1 Tax=Mesorhizobium sp. AR07 TaxID=2865838 RepID=UPI00215F77E8|nr:hypothetical protein [Mesorhizobium sp. AR07]UVK46832.1 hypothetical protein BPNPMPFG_002542 [Mesorhizobium sp. AR07]